MAKSLHDFSANTDKSWSHQYIHVYEALLEPIRSRVRNVLEIGVWDGDSLKMWRDYFDKAQIYGVDITDKSDKLANESRINFIHRDAYSDEAVNAYKTKFDVIVDDGPHTLQSQIYCANKYSELLNENGILIIEDIPYPSWIPQIAEAVPDQFKPFMYGIDRRIAPNRQSADDELLFVIDLRFTK